MPTKLQFYSELAERALEDLTANRGNWTHFLDTAARLYKYPFQDQLIIYAQRPDVTACAELEFWNEKFSRWVRLGAKGIALIDDSGSYPRLKYVFDVSDTEPSLYRARPVQLWEMRKEHEATILAELAKNYEDIDLNGTLADAFHNIARQLAGEYYDDNYREILLRTESSTLEPPIHYDFSGTPIETADDSALRAAFVEAISNSVAYTVMARCGLDPSEYFSDEDFQVVTDFNTPDMANALGVASGNLSEQVLRDIEITIRKYERQQKNSTRASAHDEYERSEQSHDQNPYLHASRGLSPARPGAERAAEGTGGAAREVRPDEESVPQRPQADNIQPPAAHGEAVPASEGNRRSGRGEDGASDGRTDGEERTARQSGRPDGVDGGDERTESAGGGDGLERTDLRVEKEQDGEQTQGAAEQAAPSDFAENNAPPEQELPTASGAIPDGEPPSRSISQLGKCSIEKLLSTSPITIDEVDSILRDGGNFDNHKLIDKPFNSRSSLRIAAHFAKDLEDNAKFLKREYLMGRSGRDFVESGKGFEFGNRRVCAWFDTDGISVAVGNAAKNNTRSATIPWDDAAARVDELMRDGRYIAHDAFYNALDNERRELADKLWHFYIDDMHGLPSEWQVDRGGWSEDVARIASLLNDDKERQIIRDRLESDITAWSYGTENRRSWHNPPRLLDDMYDAMNPPVIIPDEGFTHTRGFSHFITQDEIDALIKRGGTYTEGKFRVLSFFLGDHDETEKLAFIKREYGNGGGTWNAADGWHDSKPGMGLLLRRGSASKPDAEARVKWSAVIKRTEQLIAEGSYMTRAELDRIPNYERLMLIRQINGFYYDLSDEYERPFPGKFNYPSNEYQNEDGEKTLNFNYPHEAEWQAIRDLLDNPERVEAVLAQMRHIFENTSTEDRHYANRKAGFEALAAFREGAYTLFPGIDNLPSPETSAARRQITPATPRSDMVVDLRETRIVGIQADELQSAEQLSIFGDAVFPILPSVDEQRIRIDQPLQQEAEQSANEAEAQAPAISLDSDAHELDPPIELDFDAVAQAALERVMADTDYLAALADAKSRASLRNQCTWALEQSIGDHQQDEPEVFRRYFSDDDFNDSLFAYVLKKSWEQRPHESGFTEITDPAVIAEVEAIFGDIKPQTTAEKVYEELSPSGKGRTAYYLFQYPDDNGVGAALSHQTIALINEKADNYVICADVCYLAESEMAKWNMVFRKMPRDWHLLPTAVQEQIRTVKPEYEKEYVRRVLGSHGFAPSEENLAKWIIDYREFRARNEKEENSDAIGFFENENPTEEPTQETPSFNEQIRNRLSERGFDASDDLIESGLDKFYALGGIDDISDAAAYIENEYFYEEPDDEPALDGQDEKPAAPIPAPVAAPAANFRITDEHLGEGGAKTKFRNNMNALYALKAIESEQRSATQEEQEVLSRYVGWGGVQQAFDPDKSDWANEYNELKALLTPEEWDSARASTLNAHYTSPTIIKAVYETIERLGFRNGNILEPACGVCNFFGLLPDSMSGSKLYGVELDSVTARIARQLYPDANIQETGFEKTQFSDAFFDVAIGNVPFGSYGVVDNRYKTDFYIHDYFFQKALDKVRPGGIIAFVTSKGTLDKQKPEVRKYIAQRAELLGAVRLPNNAFLKNAGTQVSADIIFLQKRDRPLDVEPDWVHLGFTEDGLPVNRYYLDNPEMMLGTMSKEAGARMYGSETITTCVPIEGADLAEQLKAALLNIQGQYTVEELDDLDGVDDHAVPADPNVKNFSYTIIRAADGDLGPDAVYFRENSLMYPVDLPATTLNRIRGMVGLRECVQKLIALQLDDYSDADIKAQQAELNALYDGFIAKFGLISSQANSRAFNADASYYLLASLEIVNEDGELERKADMFSKRTIRQRTIVTHVDTASEALAVSIGEKARVDLDYMGELTGFSREKLLHDLQGVVFLNIGSAQTQDKAYVTADEYLSGNVREKLRQAEAAAAVDPEFSINVEALRAVQPKDLEAGEIAVRLGATWISPEYVQEFMYELLDTAHYNKNTYQVQYHAFTGEWQVTGKNRAQFSDISATVTYGTSRMNAYQILDDTLNLRDVRVYDYKEDADGKERRELNKKETMLAQQKQELIKQKFRDWIWEDPDRRQTLVQQYNELFNSVRPRDFDGSHITFSGMNPEIRLSKHQVDGAARQIYGGNTLYAHVVGAGKTFTMIASAMESKRLGLCQKSLFAVPNHLTEQWAAEFLRLYPSANILVATKKEFEMRNRKKFCAKIATGDYDAVIIGHSQLEKIPMSRERQERQMREQIWEIEEGLRELKESNGARFTIKQLEKTKRSLEVRLSKLLDTKKRDDVVTYEQLGVDRLYVDEAHGFKDL